MKPGKEVSLESLNIKTEGQPALVTVMVAAVCAGRKVLAHKVQAKDGSLLRGRVEYFGPFDKAVLF